MQEDSESVYDQDDGQVAGDGDKGENQEDILGGVDSQADEGDDMQGDEFAEGKDREGSTPKAPTTAKNKRKSASPKESPRKSPQKTPQKCVPKSPAKKKNPSPSKSKLQKLPQRRGRSPQHSQKILSEKLQKKEPNVKIPKVSQEVPMKQSNARRRLWRIW